jgi:hypothetical protein
MLRVDFKNNDRLSTLSANAPLQPNRQASSEDLIKTFCRDRIPLIVLKNFMNGPETYGLLVDIDTLRQQRRIIPAGLAPKFRAARCCSWH